MPTQAAGRPPGAHLPRPGQLPSHGGAPGGSRKGLWRRAGRPGSGATTRAWAVALLCCLGAAEAGAGDGDEKTRPGAYCRLPEPGQTPLCLTPARAAYGEFFAAIGRGRVSAAAAALVEADLAGGSGTERAYLALSSLSYGYYRLAEQLGTRPDADPVLLERLGHWNHLLVRLYGSEARDAGFRAAVREAAVDLHARAPSMAERCPHDYPGACDHTQDLVRALAAIDGAAGVRSPLGRLLERMFVSDPVETRTSPGGPEVAP